MVGYHHHQLLVFFIYPSDVTVWKSVFWFGFSTQTLVFVVKKLYILKPVLKKLVLKNRFALTKNTITKKFVKIFFCEN